MATCRPFPGDTPCGTLFEGLNHILAGDVGNVLRSINSTSTVKSSFTSDTRYACIDSPALDQAMQGLRYQTSLFCVRYALNATLNGCQPDPYPARNYLCPDQATLALDSFRALITNTELCPSVDITDPNSHAGATFQGLSLIVDRNNAAVDSSTCFSGVAEDVGLAGYSSYANAVAGCQNSNDAICAAFLQANGLASTPNGPAEPGPAPPGGAPSAPAATTRPSTTANRPIATTSGSSGQITPTSTSTPAAASSNMGVIIGGAVGGVLLIAAAVVLGIFLMRRRSSKANAPVSPHFGHNPSGMGAAASSSSSDKKIRINLNSNAPLAPPTPISVPPKGDIGGFSSQQQQQPQYQQQQYQQQSYQQQSYDQQYQQQQQHQSFGYNSNDVQMQNLSSPAVQPPAPSYQQLQQPQHQQPIPQQPTRSPSPPKAFNPVLAAVAASDGVRPPSFTPSTSTPTPPESLMRIIHPYNPTLADELQLVVGADIIVLRSFDDGWGLGMNPITGAQGAFPLVCVANDNRSSMAPSEVPASVVPDRFSKRVSSAIFTADQMNALKTVGKEEYLRTHGYDPALDEGLPSAPPTAASYGYPSFTGSVMIDPATGMPMGGPVPPLPNAAGKGVTFSEGGNSMHVYPVRDSMTSSVVTPRV